MQSNQKGVTNTQFVSDFFNYLSKSKLIDDDTIQLNIIILYRLYYILM